MWERIRMWWNSSNGPKTEEAVQAANEHGAKVDTLVKEIREIRTTRDPLSELVSRIAGERVEIRKPE